MTYQDFRQKYPKFIFEKYEYQPIGQNLEIKFFYLTPPDHKFIHLVVIENCQPPRNSEDLIFHTGLSLMPFYWKATCSPVIEIQAGQLTDRQIRFWHKLFIKGMGEYFYKNQIDFTPPDFLVIQVGEQIKYPSRAGIQQIASQPDAVLSEVEGQAARSAFANAERPSVIIPIGGGKDSVVTLELLKSHFSTVPFIINPTPPMLGVCRVAKQSPLVAKSEADHYLLHLNSQGYLTG